MKRGSSATVICQALVLFFTSSLPHSLTPSLAEAAHVEERNGLRVAFLEGLPYELGLQHGRLLKDDVRQSVRQVLGYFRRYVKIPLLGPQLANWWLDRPWDQARPFIPSDYLEELRGLA